MNSAIEQANEKSPTQLALAKYAHRKFLATIRWCGGSALPAYAGAIEGCRFLEDARAVMSICEALRSNGSLEMVPCPYNESSEKVEFYRWQHDGAWSSHSGYLIVNKGLSPERFSWVTDRLAAIWPARQGNYAARGPVPTGANDVASFETCCYGTGD